MQKKCFLFLLFMIIGVQFAFSQTFYVSRTDDGIEKPIIDKLLSQNYNVTFKKDSSDYILTCMIVKKRAGKATGYVAIIDNKTGKLLGKTNTLKGYSYMFNGFSNPKLRISKRIADKYLIGLIKRYTKK